MATATPPADRDHSDTGRLEEADVLAHLGRLEKVPEMHRRLRACPGVAAMLAEAAELIRVECDFARVVVLTVGDGELSAAGTHALEHPASDRVRRHVQAAPVPLVPGTLEHQLVSGPGRARRRRAEPHSLLAAGLTLVNHAFAPVAPESDVLALLVVDRPRSPLSALDRAMVASIAAMLGVTFEHLVLRARMAEVSMELRGLTSSAQALMTEVLHAPVSMPTERRDATTFPRAGVGRGLPRGGLRDVLTPREDGVARLLVQGRSNREIAAELIISTATVKDCVLRIRRKLGAANRVDAAARYLQLTQAPVGEA